MGAMQFVGDVKEGRISVVEHTAKTLDEAKKKNKTYKPFVLIAEAEAIAQAEELEKQIKAGKHKGRFLGIPISVKDSICVKGIESRAGSRILSGYKPVFDATCIDRLRVEGAIIIGKTAQDEFGFGSFSVNVGLGFAVPKNPFDIARCTGGSSGGAAAFTALAKNTHIAVGESTGGSIASPASFCGVAGFTPTYGRVSRYGLMDYASSLDKIGSIGKSVADSALMLEVIAGHDAKDATSVAEKADNYTSFIGKPAKGMKIGVVKELMGKGIDKEVSKAVWNTVKALEKEGIKYDEVSLPLNSKYSLASYYLIAMSEASTNLAKYQGMRYGLHEDLEGNFDEYFTKVRSRNFGEEAKRRIIIGTFARMAGFRYAYYLKAMKVRTLLIEEYRKLFRKYDALVNPSMPFIAPKFREIEKLSPLQNYMADICTIPANLAGLPHISVKCGESKGMPIGIMLTAEYLQEGKLVQLGSAVERVGK